MISKKAVLLGGLSLLIGTASVAAAKEAICSEQIMPTVLTAQKRPDAKNQRYDLTFIPKPDRKETLTVNGKAVPFYAYENRVYVSHPKAAESESLTLYIPAAYLEGGRINGYSQKQPPFSCQTGWAAICLAKSRLLVRQIAKEPVQTPSFMPYLAVM